MKKCLQRIAWCLLVLTTHAAANGGGYVIGGVENTGNIAGFEPSSTEKIRILDEKLIIRLRRDHADVEVSYLMRNETARKVKVRFGFPVEESRSYNELTGQPQPKPNADASNPAYCRNYQITAAGKKITAKWKSEARAKPGSPFQGLAGWLVSEVSFAANEEKPLRITFQSSYPVERWSVSEDSSTHASTFKYRLSTAACWAGTIGTGKITIIPDGIPAGDVRILKPANRFKKQENRWVWDFENLEPTLADDFEVEARPAVTRYSRPSTEGDDDGKNTVTYIESAQGWSMAHANYRVKASSTLPPDGELKYDADNIRNPWQDMWSEGAPGSGSGEWLEIEPIVPKPIIAISIIPGCVKSDELFKANARPRNVEVLLNGEHRIQAEIPDSKEEFEIPIQSYQKEVKRVRITFKDVWPGSRFEDLCITSIRLHARLHKKPKIQPAR